MKWCLAPWCWSIWSIFLSKSSLGNFSKQELCNNQCFLTSERGSLLSFCLYMLPKPDLPAKYMLCLQAGGAPQIQKIETLWQIVWVSSHTVIHASWLFGFLSMFTAWRNLPMKCKKAPIHASSLSNAVHGCWRLLIVVKTCTCSPYPRRKLTALLVSRINGEMKWLYCVYLRILSINISRLISYSFVVGLH